MTLVFKCPIPYASDVCFIPHTTQAFWPPYPAIVSPKNRTAYRELVSAHRKVQIGNNDVCTPSFAEKDQASPSFERHNLIRNLCFVFFNNLQLTSKAQLSKSE